MEDFFLLVFQSSSEAVRGNTSTGGLNGGLDENESYSESMNSMKSASPYQHSYSPTEYNPYAPAINSQSAYSGYVPRYQQPPYSAYNSFPPYARTKPSHASSIHSIPGNNLPYPLQPSESMGAGGYGTIGQSSGYSNSASLSMFPRENFRNAAPYGQAPTQAQLWGTPRVHHSHVSRITQNEVPSRHTNADNHQLNTELSQESIAQQSLYTEMSLPIQPAADASCSDQSPEVTEFLTTVMQALGKELFKLFLGELTSLRLLVKNKKSMFAQKVMNI